MNVGHTHEIVDGDKCFAIDPISRTIANTSEKVKLIQFDHDSERFTFQCPRIIEGHDMTLCNSVRVQYINSNKRTGQDNSGVYEINDLTVDSEDSAVITFSWLISQNATKFVGTLNFLIDFRCIADDGSITYAWHTDIYKGVVVSAGMNNGKVIEEKYPDVLEKWRNEVMAAIPDAPSQVGVQSDWNQTDETALDYVKNRPGACTVQGTLLDEQITDTEFVSESGMYIAGLNTIPDLVVGQKYDVVYNGIEYKALEANSFGDSIIYIGELNSERKQPAFTVYPFFIELVNGSHCYLLCPASTNVSIQINGSIIVKIPAKYLDIDLSELEKSVQAANDAASAGKQLAQQITIDNSNRVYVEKSAGIIFKEALDPNGAFGNIADGIIAVLPHKDGISFAMISEKTHMTHDFCKITKNDLIIHSTSLGIKSYANSGLSLNEFCVIEFDGSQEDKAVLNLLYRDASSVYEQSCVVNGTLEVTGKKIILNSSTSGSTKKFQITVDDSGKLTATEVAV